MRKNMIFGVIGFALALVAGGHAFAAGTTPTNISMGMFSIPLPSNGVDGKDGKDGAAGCTPTITVGEKDNNTGCYTVTIQKQKLGTNGCENDGGAITRTTCDGANGVGGGDIDVDDRYVPYPQSTQVDGAGQNQQGFVEKLVNDEVVAKIEDYCERDYDNEDGARMKCIAQGDATSWPTGGPYYQSGGVYYFPITDLATTLDDTIEPNPFPFYVRPVLSGENSVPGYTEKVSVYLDGHRTYDFAWTDECDKYANRNDRSDIIKVCTVGEPGETSGAYVKGKKYCLDLADQSNCSLYTVPVGAVDVCAGLTDSDEGWNTTVSYIESDYVQHVYPVSGGTCTNNCQGKIGYKETKEVMCSGDIQESQNLDSCGEANPANTGGVNVTCYTGYTWQKCTNQTDSTDVYYGCFPNTTGRAVVSRQTNQYQGPDLTNKIKGYTYTLVTYSNGDTDRIDKHEDECDPVIGETSESDNTLKTGQRCKCGGRTSSAPCNVANGTYLLGVYGSVQDLKDLMENQVQVIIRYDSTTRKLYYCIQDGCLSQPYTNTAYWSPVDIDGLAGQDGTDGRSCLATKSGSDWYICCSPTWTGDDCTKITDDGIISMLNGIMCHTNYTKQFLHDNPGGGDPIANDTEEGSIGTKITLTDSCNSSNSQSYNIYHGAQGPQGPQGNAYDPCNGVSGTDALSRIHHETSVYIHHGDSNTSTTTTGKGYYKRTNVMCDQSGNEDIYQYDPCHTVADARIASSVTSECNANQTLVQCKPQEDPFDEYFICENAEVNLYPKKVYVQPELSGGKLIKRGYTKLIHKFTSTGSEVVERHDPDQCYKVYKQSLVISTDGTKTATTTTTSVLKCEVQNYPNPTAPWTVGREYCLDTDSSGSCTGYGNEITSQQTYTLKYHLPEMESGNTPVAPGYAYTEVSVGGSVLYVTEPKPDECDSKLVTKMASGDDTVITGVTKCFVRAPGDSTNGYSEGREYCLGYANGTCPNNIVGIGSVINDPCSSLSASATEEQKMALIKKTTRLYTEPAGSGTVKTAVGFTVFTRETCSTNTPSVTDKEEDICNPVMPADPTVCTDGVYYACSNPNYNNGNTYYYCDTTYPQCAGTNSNSDSILKKTVRSYTGPEKTNASNNYYTTVGKMTDKKIACSNAEISTNESMEDECHEIADSSSSPVCPANASVRKTCKRQGAAGTFSAESEYTLCTTGLSIAASDPCEGDTTSSDAKKKVKKIEYEYVEQSALSDVGFTKKTTVMCHSSEPNKEEYIYDTCISMPAVSDCGNGNGSYYKCYNQTKLTSDIASEREYNVCNPNSNVSTVALADSVKAQSLFEIWKEQYKDLTSTKCTALFGDGKTNCQTDLDETDMLNNINAYGVWKTDQVVNKSNTTATELTFAKYQESLQPCKNGFSIVENAEYSGNGKEYVMVCNE